MKDESEVGFTWLWVMLLKKTLKYEKSCWLYFIGPVNGKTKEKGGTKNPRDSVSSSLLVNPVCDLSRFHE
ncbi:hypothetical protein V1477_008574 [Vespula maculifrons]|uniref:Uncharacterized protein n=1 Tax=Vespula maculifrons TaxID=7453 RepID=A0ABD2CDE9_VESMC